MSWPGWTAQSVAAAESILINIGLSISNNEYVTKSILNKYRILNKKNMAEDI